MILRCDNCGAYHSDDDCDEKEVCLESEYGVGSMFPDHHYETVLVCSKCGSTDLAELKEDECVEELNELREKLKNARRKKV